MACDLLDLQCIFVGELIGSFVLTVIALAIVYFIIASKLRFGFDTTLAVLIPILLIGGIAIGGLTSVMAFATLFVAILLAWAFNKVIGNR